jgi:hypothetical protein
VSQIKLQALIEVADKTEIYIEGFVTRNDGGPHSRPCCLLLCRSDIESIML